MGKKMRIHWTWEYTRLPEKIPNIRGEFCKRVSGEAHAFILLPRQLTDQTLQLQLEQETVDFDKGQATQADYGVNIAGINVQTVEH
jgi:NAD dependent epimerase/dehydratase family enzyme